MNRSQVLIILLEEIAGNATIVYHRTGEKAFINPQTGEELSGKAIPENILQQGFAEGKSGMYGPGIYATYRLDSQLRKSMSTYGDYLVKCRVNLQGYIILDYTEAKKVYRDIFTLRDQLGQYYSSRWLDKEAVWIAQSHEQLQQHTHEATSNIALALYEKYHISTVVPGLVFKGQHDDAVVVTYKSDAIIPVSYTYHPTGTETPVDWTPVDVPTYTRHIRRVGSLIRTPPVDKPDSARIFQRLSRSIKLSNKNVVNKLSKIKSLSIEIEGIPYTPTLDELPNSLVTVMTQKFRHPDVEFYRCISPLLAERFQRFTTYFCRVLQASFPKSVVTCQRIVRHSLKITFAFPTVVSVLLFIEHLLSHEIYNIQPILDFLRSDTKTARENILKVFVEKSLQDLREDDFFNFSRSIPQYTRAVQDAPSTK